MRKCPNIVKSLAQDRFGTDFYDAIKSLKPFKSSFMLNKQTTQKEEVRLDANVGEHIGYELGAKMIKDYYDKYNEGGAHFVGRNIIEKILQQPDCIGIKIFKALNEEGNKTYVMTGVNSEGQPILEITAVNPNGEMKIEEGIVADRKTFTGWVDIIFD